MPGPTEHCDETGAGVRLVPIVPELRRLGFLRWAESQQAKERRLVEGPQSSNDWSKWCNRYLDDIGFTDEKLTLYSLRHAFKQMLRAANIGDELQNKVFGHEGGVADGYGRELAPGEARVVAAAVKSPIPMEHLWQLA